MDEQPFSDAGMILFGVGIMSLALIAIAVMIAGYVVARRNRILSGCGAGCAALLAGSVVMVVINIVAMSL